MPQSRRVSTSAITSDSVTCVGRDLRTLRICLSRACVRSYYCIGNLCLSCTVTDIFSVEYLRDLDIWVRDHSLQSHRKWQLSIDHSCTRSHLRFIVGLHNVPILYHFRDISRTSRFFVSTSHLHSTPLSLKMLLSHTRPFKVI